MGLISQHPVFSKLSARLSEEKWPQLWSWAVSFLEIIDLSDFATSFCFPTVTYTTLEYGNIVLGPAAGIVATFCAITGLLTFGISTAFLIGVLARILPDVFQDDRRA